MERNSRCGNIEISEDGIFELVDQKRALGAKKAEIMRVILTKGFGAQRPLLQALFGLMLIGAGSSGFRAIALWWREGGTLTVDMTLIVLGLIPFGIWILSSAVKRKMILLLETQTGKQKVTFHEKIPRQEIEAFASENARQYGYHLTVLLE